MKKNKQVIEFKNKDGQVVLKKVQLTEATDDGTGSGYVGWLCTYYIYDNLGGLRCVVQPKGVNSILPPLSIMEAWLLTDITILAEQCFRYEYDERKQMIIKKVPGAGEIYMVYDAIGRLVMTQDANMRLATNNKWMITLYDGLNRPTQTGLLLNSLNNNSFTAHLTAASNSTSYPFTATTVPSAAYWEQLSKTFFDDYNWLADEGNPVPKDRYTSDDTYLKAISLDRYTEPYTQSFQTQGMVTGTKTKVIGTSTYLYSGIYYDAKGRVIGSYAQTLNNGSTITNNLYNFSSQLLCNIQTTTNNSIVISLPTQYDYDDLGRLLTIKKTVNSNIPNVSVPEKIIVSNKYDALGQLKSKQLSPNFKNADLHTGLETLNYDYNIRGWLLGMNRDYINDLPAPKLTSTDPPVYNYFGFDLGYDKNGCLGNYSNLAYNGNISGTIWKSKGDLQKRKYDFIYDAPNRLMEARFTQYVSGSLFDNSAKVDFGVDNISYDANGNILSMWQKGLKGTNSDYIDKLTYNYTTKSNKLLNVTDAMNEASTKLGDFRTSALYLQAVPSKTATTADYMYDLNGNLSKDLNKDIVTSKDTDGILYNYLNLPSQITIKLDNTTGSPDKGLITYTYDAGGNKLRKVITENKNTANSNIATTTTIDYIGTLVYESKVHDPAAATDYTNKLQFISHEEGRIRGLYKSAATPNTLTDLVFDYFVKDHLGNVRMVLTEETPINIYPAATLEGTYTPPGNPPVNSMINYEKQYYNTTVR